MFNENDAFDLALALYHWLQHNWQGQSDAKYAEFCTLSEHYKPSRSEQLFDNIDDSAREVYDNLTDANYREALTIVLNYESQG